MHKIKIESVLVFVVIIVTLLSSCAGNYSPRCDNGGITGKILFKGDAISGSEDLYWTYELETCKISKILNPSTAKILELRYFLNIPTNRDEGFVLRKNSFFKNQTNLLYLPSVIQKFFTKKDQSEGINNFINGSNTINTKNFKVVLDVKKKRLSVWNKTKGLKSFLTFKDYVFGEILSPDSRYLALFLNNPTAFRDGSVYNIVVLRLDDLRLTKLSNLEIGMPGAMIWVN